MNIQGGLSGGYIRKARLGSLPKIANSYAQLTSHILVLQGQPYLYKGSLLHSLTGWYVLHYFVSITGLVI